MPKLATEPVMVRPEVKRDIVRLAYDIAEEEHRSRVSLGDVVALAVKAYIDQRNGQ